MALNYHPSCSFLVNDDRYDFRLARGAARRSGNGDGCSGLSYYYPNQGAIALSRGQPLTGNTFLSLLSASQGLPPRAPTYLESLTSREQASSNASALVCRDSTVDSEDVIMFALPYLGLRDRLAVEMVCRSLHSAVRSDESLWKCIHVEPALSGKMYDPDLLSLTRKMPGVLQCLNINDCINITDNGLNAVLESNPKLTKLSIACCPRLTLDGLIANLKSFNMKERSGIKSLRIDKNFSLPKEDYEGLLSLLNMDKMQELHNRGPRFRHANHFVSVCKDGYALDVEMCPICESYKLVFDCPEEECNDRRCGKCRACEVCIKRCRQCGRCLGRNEKFEEKFDLVYICYKCRGHPASSLAGEEYLLLDHRGATGDAQPVSHLSFY